MAERRMFAKSIINSARFLRMPQTSRLLYYDLGMAADDDGVVEAFTVIRTTGAAEDDLRVLASRGFVTVLNDDLVSYITDWSRNNLIKKDRYHESAYAELLVKLSDGNQAEPCGNTSGTQTEPGWNQSGTQVEHQVRLGKVRLGKGRLGESTADKPPRAPRFTPPTVEEVAAYCRERGNGVDAEHFVDFYASNGWKVGKNSMKDWRAAVRTWEKRDKADKGGSGNVFLDIAREEGLV